MQTACARRRVHRLLMHLQPSAAAQHARGGLHTAAVAAAAANQPSGFAAPLDALCSGPLATPAETAVRDAARALLPWNLGADLDVATQQKLRPVGVPSFRSTQSGAVPPPLFREIRLGPQKQVRLKNRVVVSPMCTYSSDDGFLNDFHLVHLGSFALGGAAMVIVEATAVAPEGRISPVDSGLWKDEQMAPLKRLAAFLRSQDCVAGIQLAHAGRKASTLPSFHYPRPPAPLPRPALGPERGGWPQDIKGPSDRAFQENYHVPHEMSVEEIRTVTRQYVEAAQRAASAGFDFVEIHAAHGYLLSSFLSPTSNRRTDSYGGSLENRCRLLLETVRAVRSAFSGVLAVRVSCVEWVEGGWSMEDTLALVSMLAPLGVDVMDCSSGGNNPAQKIVVKPGYQVDFARQVKAAHPDLTVAAVGLITEPSQANDIVEQGQADLVLLARQLMRHPHWPLDAAKSLGYDMEWAPQYQRAKPTSRIASIP